MKKGKPLIGLLVMLTFGISQEISMAQEKKQSSFENLLTVSDVEEVTGLKGFKLFPRDGSKGRHWDLNFESQKVTLAIGVVAIGVYITQGERAPAVWKGWTEQAAIIKSQGGKVTKVTGVGDEAFESEIAMGGRSFYFRKGKDALAIESGEIMKGYEIVPLLSSEQMHALARIIISRL